MPNASIAKRDVEKVADIIRDAGGEVVGRTRLQKLAYLLELAGMGEGFSFEYRHYGPYSSELAAAAKRADLLGLIKVSEEVANWGGHYSIFRSDKPAARKTAKSRQELALLATKADPVELELAATAAFLSFVEDPWEETARRKPDKASGGRIERAKALYRALSQIRTPKPLPNIA